MSVVIPAEEANTEAAQPFSVFADLRLDTEGYRVHVVGDGQSLVVHTTDPRRLFHDVRELALPVDTSGLTGRTAVGRAATALQNAGLRVDVRGPDGVLVRLGDGTGSTFGRIVTGSSAVQFGKLRDLSAAARLPVKRIAGVLATAIAVGAIVLLRRAR